MQYTRNDFLFESSLSRVWSHAHKGFIMMSAYRGNNLEANKKNHLRLKSKLKDLKLGFFEIDGVYKYDNGTTESELSVFIPWNKEKYTIEEFKKIAKDLRSDFNQESVLFFNDKSEAFLLYASREDKIGSGVGYDKVASAYSKLRKGAHQGKSFVIEGVRIPSNHISAYGMLHEGIMYSHNKDSIILVKNQDGKYITLEESFDSEAYWISNSGVIIPISTFHINDIISNPSKYGYTDNIIDNIYKKYDEKKGFEGKAREEIMKNLIDKGWIRLRLNKKQYSWTIQLNRLDNKKKDYLQKWAENIINTKYKNTSVVILTNTNTVNKSLVGISRDELYEGLQIPEKRAQLIFEK